MSPSSRFRTLPICAAALMLVGAVWLTACQARPTTTGDEATAPEQSAIPDRAPGSTPVAGEERQPEATERGEALATPDEAEAPDTGAEVVQLEEIMPAVTDESRRVLDKIDGSGSLGQILSDDAEYESDSGTAGEVVEVEPEHNEAPQTDRRERAYPDAPAFIGIYCDDWREKKRRGPKRRGVMVESLIPDTAAVEVGLQPGDVILAVNGRQTKFYKHLRKVLAQYRAGDEGVLRVLRDGGEFDQPITFCADPQHRGRPHVEDDRYERADGHQAERDKPRTELERVEGLVEGLQDQLADGRRFDGAERDSLDRKLEGYADKLERALDRVRETLDEAGPDEQDYAEDIEDRLEDLRDRLEDARERFREQLERDDNRGRDRGCRGRGRWNDDRRDQWDEERRDRMEEARERAEEARERAEEAREQTEEAQERMREARERIREAQERLRERFGNRDDHDPRDDNGDDRSRETPAPDAAPERETAPDDGVTTIPDDAVTADDLRTEPEAEAGSDDTEPPAGERRLTLDHLLGMKAAGLGEETILATVRASWIDFRVTLETIRQLQDAGFSDRAIDAILDRATARQL